MESLFSTVKFIFCIKDTENIACDLEELAFISVDAVVRATEPRERQLIYVLKNSLKHVISLVNIYLKRSTEP